MYDATDLARFLAVPTPQTAAVAGAVVLERLSQLVEDLRRAGALDPTVARTALFHMESLPPDLLCSALMQPSVAQCLAIRRGLAVRPSVFASLAIIASSSAPSATLDLELPVGDEISLLWAHQLAEHVSSFRLEVAETFGCLSATSRTGARRVLEARRDAPGQAWRPGRQVDAHPHDRFQVASSATFSRLFPFFTGRVGRWSFSRSVDSLVDVIDSALLAVERSSYRTWVADAVHYLIPIHSVPGVSLSGSSDVLGVVSMAPTDADDAFEVLVHEASHQYFHVLEMFDRLTLSDKKHWSAATNSMRSGDRILAAVHAFANVYLAKQELGGSAHPHGPRVSDSARLMSLLRASREVATTPVAAAFLDAIVQRLDGLEIAENSAPVTASGSRSLSPARGDRAPDDNGADVVDLILRDSSPTPMAVLHVGCGDGKVLRALLRRNWATRPFGVERRMDHEPSDKWIRCVDGDEPDLLGTVPPELTFDVCIISSSWLMSLGEELIGAHVERLFHQAPRVIVFDDVDAKSELLGALRGSGSIVSGSLGRGFEIVLEGRRTRKRGEG